MTEQFRNPLAELSIALLSYTRDLVSGYTNTVRVAVGKADSRNSTGYDEHPCEYPHSVLIISFLDCVDMVNLQTSSYSVPDRSRVDIDILGSDVTPFFTGENQRCSTYEEM